MRSFRRWSVMSGLEDSSAWTELGQRSSLLASEEIQTPGSGANTGSFRLVSGTPRIVLAALR